MMWLPALLLAVALCFPWQGLAFAVRLALDHVLQCVTHALARSYTWFIRGSQGLDSSWGHLLMIDISMHLPHPNAGLVTERSWRLGLCRCKSIRKSSGRWICQGRSQDDQPKSRDRACTAPSQRIQLKGEAQLGAQHCRAPIHIWQVSQ